MCRSRMPEVSAWLVVVGTEKCSQPLVGSWQSHSSINSPESSPGDGSIRPQSVHMHEHRRRTMGESDVPPPPYQSKAPPAPMTRPVKAPNYPRAEKNVDQKPSTTPQLVVRE